MELEFAQGHTARKWQGWNENSVLCDPKTRFWTLHFVDHHPP